MGRAGRKDKDQGDRRCIVTGGHQPRAGLIRFVLSPEGVVTPDLAERLPGRGMWLAADKGVFAKAVKKNPFSRAAKTAATVPEDLIGLVDSLLARRVIEHLSLARKGGYAICGYDKTRSALLAEGVAMLVQASDGSEGQKRKLRPPKGEDSLISCLKSHELGLAFGREHVIHAALAAGGLTERVRSDAAKLAALRSNDAKQNGSQTAGKPVVKGKDTQ